MLFNDLIILSVSSVKVSTTEASVYEGEGDLHTITSHILTLMMSLP